MLPFGSDAQHRSEGSRIWKVLIASTHTEKDQQGSTVPPLACFALEGGTWGLWEKRSRRLVDD